MVRIPRGATDVLVEQVAAFPEPDHAPELEMQRALEEKRDGKRLSVEEMYPTDQERQGWAWAYVGTDEPTFFEQVAEVRELVAEANARVPPPLGADPATLPAGTEERGAREREALRVWRKGGQKGPRPLTPAIEALGARPGCTPARDD